MRFDVIKETTDTMEAEQKAQFQSQTGLQAIEDPKSKGSFAAKAELVRATISRWYLITRSASGSW